MTEQFANASQTTLSGNISAGDVTVAVVDASGFPATGDFRVLFESADQTKHELVKVTGVSGNIFTVSRSAEAYNGDQTAYSFDSGDTVSHVLTAGGLAALPGGATPTLADVLAEGNETGGTEIAAGPVVSTGSTGAKLQMEEGSQSATPGGNAILQGGAGAPTQDGGYSAIAGGQGEDEESTPVSGASITAYGGEADGTLGKIEITTNGTDGALGNVLVSDGIYDTWQAVVTDVSSTPVAGGYQTPLVADTTAKKLYAWTGSDYVQIGDWT